MHRRTFLKQSAIAGLSMQALPLFPSSIQEKYPPVQKLTQGAKSHWFGYYDKHQVDPTGRYVLGMEVDIPMRSPTEKDEIRIGMVDLHDNNRWIDIGKSHAWGWQQGCMLQWLPGAGEEIIWNDQENGQFISRILNIKTGKTRTLPKAIYTLSPDGKFAVGTEFNRIQNMRPGYGYPGIPDPYASVKAPEETGIYRMDLQTGEHPLIISLAEMAALPHQGKSLADKWHYFNHLLVSPDSQRFIFLHRWREAPANTPAGASGGFTTRLFTADVKGENTYMLDPSGNTSHFIWRDPQHICAWTKPEGKKEAFYLFKDKTEEVTAVGEDKMTVNGHNTYLPGSGNDWILNDTYPDKEDRKQTLYLYHVPADRKVVLGRFYEPPEFKGEWRCDLHPRASQDGTKVIFDSTHENNQRQMYMVDISEIVS